MANFKKILLTGATGFIGSHIQQVLEKHGYVVIPVSRRCGYNFNQMTKMEDWLPLLENIDVVINSVGIIAETQGQTFQNLHHRAPVALFHACKKMGVKRVIQISALGADEQAFTLYQLSKKSADDELRRLTLDWFILRPSLVYGKRGKSIKLFQRLAMLPIIPLVGNGKQLIQPVHISDVVASVLQCLQTKTINQTLDIVGAYPLTFVDWLQLIRRKQGKKPALTIAIPFKLILTTAWLGKFLQPMLHPDNLRMLQQGNTADVQPLTKFLGRSPLTVEEGL